MLLRTPFVSEAVLGSIYEASLDFDFANIIEHIHLSKRGGNQSKTCKIPCRANDQYMISSLVAYTGVLGT